MFQLKKQKQVNSDIDMDESTFNSLLEMVSIKVLFSDMDGAFHRQIDGVAMG